jgi:hypothetical protein
MRKVLVTVNGRSTPAGVVENMGRAMRVRYADGTEQVVNSLDVTEADGSPDFTPGQPVLITLLAGAGEFPGTMVTPHEQPGFHRIKLSTGQDGLMPADRVHAVPAGELSLYLIRRHEGADYGESAGFVVVAAGEQQARELAAQAGGSESMGTWVYPKFSSCERLGPALPHLKAGVVLNDHREG